MDANNPMFSSFEQGVSENSATFSGITNKTIFLLIITIVSAVMVLFTGILSYPILIGSTILGVVAVIMGRVKPNIAHIASVIYAICEGVFLGYISFVFDSFYPGSVQIAIIGTFSIFTVMLLLYKSNIVQATPTFYKVMGAASLGILITYLMMFCLSLFGLFNGISIFDPLYAIICILLIAYASFMLVLNFDEAKYYVDNGLDKKYEWSAALGLIITIIYIYIRVLKFAAILVSRRD